MIIKREVGIWQGQMQRDKFSKRENNILSKLFYYWQYNKFVVIWIYKQGEEKKALKAVVKILKEE